MFTSQLSLIRATLRTEQSLDRCMYVLRAYFVRDGRETGPVVGLTALMVAIEDGRNKLLQSRYPPGRCITSARIAWILTNTNKALHL